MGLPCVFVLLRPTTGSTPALQPRFRKPREAHERVLSDQMPGLGLGVSRS